MFRLNRELSKTAEKRGGSAASVLPLRVKESHVKGFQVLEELFGKTTSPPTCPAYPMPHPAVIPLYPHRIPLPAIVMTLRKC
jgi:hypothetical protein